MGGCFWLAPFRQMEKWKLTHRVYVNAFRRHFVCQWSFNKNCQAMKFPIKPQKVFNSIPYHIHFLTSIYFWILFLKSFIVRSFEHIAMWWNRWFLWRFFFYLFKYVTLNFETKVEVMCFFYFSLCWVEEDLSSVSMITLEILAKSIISSILILVDFFYSFSLVDRVVRDFFWALFL